MKKFLYISTIIYLLINCSTIPKLSQENAHNYITTGFLDSHHLQIILKVKPAKNTKGLVNQRESAITQARANYKERLLNTLVTYTLDKKTNPNENNLNQKIPTKILLELKKLLNNGEIIAEYYEDDNSVVIVYRITKYKLRNTFESYRHEIVQ